MISFDVAGTPAPQGSKRGIAVAGRVRMIESSKKVQPWRSDVRDAAQAANTDGPIVGAVVVHLRFRMPRISSLPKTKPAPAHTKRPDLDKLVRSTLDALTSAGIYNDDSQVVRVVAGKRYAHLDEAAGCRIVVCTEDEWTNPDIEVPA